MPKYKVLMSEDHFLEFIFNTEERDEDMAYFRFLELSNEEQKRFLVNSSCYTWEIESIKRIEGE